MTGRLRHSILVCAVVTAGLTARADEPQSVKLQKGDDFLSPPVLLLSDPGASPLVLSFDLMGDAHRYLRASLTHTTPFGAPSGLLESEYASEFNQTSLEDFAYSQNTFRHYVNYRLPLPTPDLQPLLSGRYTVNVWDEDEPDSLLLSVPFYVSEGAGTLQGSASHITDRGSAGEWQQLAFTYTLPRTLAVHDPLQELTVIAVQNSDPSTAHTLKPLRLEGNRLIFEHRPELLFPASNEFRRMEISRTDMPVMHTDSLRFDGVGYSAFLTPDYPRTERPYEYDRTQWGRFKVREYFSTDSDLGADYLPVTFTLVMPRVMNGDPYVQGEFTGYKTLPRYRMVWDEERHLYTLTLPLKQGHYNYRYALAAEPGRAGEPGPVEGNKYETSNEYTIYIYYTPPGARYSRLLNVATIIS